MVFGLAPVVMAEMPPPSGPPLLVVPLPPWAVLPRTNVRFRVRLRLGAWRPPPDAIDPRAVGLAPAPPWARLELIDESVTVRLPASTSRPPPKPPPPRPLRAVPP